MGRAGECRGVEDVEIARSDVEVATDDDVAPRWVFGLEKLPKGAEPLELCLVVLAAHGATVGHIDACHFDPSTARGYQASLAVELAKCTNQLSWRARGATAHFVEPDAGDDGHAVPRTVAVVSRLISEAFEEACRERVVGKFGLLQAQDVRLDIRHPSLDERQARPQGVDVPGCKAHCEPSGALWDEHEEEVDFTGSGATD